MTSPSTAWRDYYALLVNQWNELIGLRAVYTANTAIITVSPIVTTASVKIKAANPLRKGLIIYNNSANSGYIAFGSPASSSTNMTHIIPTFTSYAMPFPIYTGDVYAIRNAGTGTFLITELT